MAIRHRRGDYNNFEPQKMVAGEFAYVNSSDPNTDDGKGVYATFSGGKTKRLCTYDEVSGLVKQAENIKDDVTQIKSDVAGMVDDADNYAKLSESYAVGTGNTVRPNDDEDNAKFYKEWVENAFNRVLPTVFLDFSTGLLMYTGSALSFDLDTTTGMLEWNM